MAGIKLQEPAGKSQKHDSIMIHPHTRLQFIDDAIGYGVFATEPIPAGTITYVKDALEIDLHNGHELLSTPAYIDHIKKYAYREASGNHVIGWDLSKYVNHSCDANTLSTGFGFEIAVSDIEPGEEITDDYGMLNPDSPMSCYCQKINCRWEVQPNDMDYLWQKWDEKVINVLNLLLTVPQPMLELLDAEVHKSLIYYLNTGKNYASVKALKFHYSLEHIG